MNPTPRPESKAVSTPILLVVALLGALSIGIFVFGVQRFTRRHESVEVDAAVDMPIVTEPSTRPRFLPRTQEPAIGENAPHEALPTALPNELPAEAPAAPTPLDAGNDWQTALAQAQQLALTDAAEARRLLEQLAERFPRNERVLTALASSLDGTDDERARDVARRCLEVNISSVRCNTVMFSTYDRAGDYDAGLPYIIECIRADSNDMHCLAGLLESRIHRGESLQALAVSDRIRERDDGGFGVYATGRAAEASGQTEAAIREYQRACSLGYDAGCAQAAALSAASR